MINEQLLKNEELAVYKLRELYSKYGYMQYKMSKFEEYDLYVRNKDFLISDRIITFTDTNGKLLALKPDVTLSIINHLGTDDSVQKLYYNENVYRVSGESHRFKEIMQTGLECVGNIGLYEICEVTSLAIKSLSLIDEDYQLDISHAGLVSAILNENGLADDIFESVKECIYLKNSGEITKLYNEGKITKEQMLSAVALVNNYSSVEELQKKLIISSEKSKQAFSEFLTVLDTLKAMNLLDKVNINFSLANNMNYYSGIVFKGYIKGIPTGVLSGGQYDSLMKKLKKNVGAIGFAVYLDSFERLDSKMKEYDVDVLLVAPKDSNPQQVLKMVEELSQSGETVLVRQGIPNDVKFKRTIIVDGKENTNA